APRRFTPHGANAADAQRPPIEHCRQVVPVGTGEDVVTVDQREGSLVTAAPGRFRPGRVKLAVRLAIQSAVRRPTRGVEDTLENGAFPRKHGRHGPNMGAWIPPARALRPHLDLRARATLPWLLRGYRTIGACRPAR